MSVSRILCGVVTGAALLVWGCASAPPPQATLEPPTVTAQPVDASLPDALLPEEGVVEESGPDVVAAPLRLRDESSPALDDPVEPPDFVAALVWPRMPWFGPEASGYLFVAGGDTAGGDELTPPAIAVPQRWDVDKIIEEMTVTRRRATERALVRAGRYLPMIHTILAEQGLPEELAYLPMVESHYVSDARSHANAVGLWQFIASTARNCGLRVDWWVDERLDPEAATRAAAFHLEELHERFGDWELVLAAYNAGPNGVARALKREQVQTFWELAAADALRAETRRYVPKFYAALSIFSDPGRYGFTGDARAAPLVYDTVWVDSPVDVHTVSRLTGASPEKIKQLNPALHRGCTPPGQDRYALRVPAGMGEGVGNELAKLGATQRLDFLRHTVARGDSVWSISRRYATEMAAITEINRITDARLIRPGQNLVIPIRRSHARAATSFASDGRMVHTVRSGETVWKIARVYDVSVAQVTQWNGLGSGGMIRPGQRLIVAPLRPAGRVVSQGGGHDYVVAPGDTLWAISRRSGISVDDLLRWNGLGGGTLLHPGDRLRLSSLAD